MANAKALAQRMLTILHNDREGRLLRIDDYLHGKQDAPYVPDHADAEYRQLAQRCITNVLPMVVDTPAQAMYVDSYRPGRTSTQPTANTKAVHPAWDHWQRSRLDARQDAVHAGAISFGHSFAVTEKLSDGVRTRGLSALNTTALFVDQANDDKPYAALTVTRFPTSESPGTAEMWDRKFKWTVTFKSFHDLKNGVSVSKPKLHGNSECPVTRFAASVDLEGRTWGTVEPMMMLQDRLNQTVFDLLIVQSYGSFKVRTVSGMAPPLEQQGYDIEGEKSDDPEAIVEFRPKLDSNGKPIPLPMNVSARRFLFAEDHETRFSSLDETPLGGFIEAIEQAFQQIAALSQTPPHHLLGQIANLSAEALDAAENALMRRVKRLQAQFGESWERVFRLAAELEGTDGAEDFAGEVVWRDIDDRGLAKAADGLGKLAEMLGIPKRGLWDRVPGVTAIELGRWEQLFEDENADLALANAVTRASGNGSLRPTFRALDEPAA